MLRVLTAFAAAAILLLSWARTTALVPPRDRGLLPLDPPTPYYRFAPTGAVRGRVLVIHGLDASKDVMRMFCAALTEGGFEVYAIDLPGHGESPAGFTATGARSVIAQALDRVGPVDVVIGHSLGAGLVLDLANERAMPHMVLLSPPPTPLDHVDLSHTLVVTGEWDIPAVKEFAPQLEGAEWWQLKWAAHSSVLFNIGQTREIIGWMGGRTENLQGGRRLGWSVLMLGSSILLGICLLPGRPARHLEINLRTADACAWFALAGTASVMVLRVVSPLGWLHLFSTGYLINELFLIGLVLCGFAFGTGRLVLSPFWSALAGAYAVGVAALGAAYVVVVVGMLSASQFINFSLADGRWWRFPAITFASFPLFFFDASALRNRNLKETALTAVVTRTLVGASIVTGALIFNRQDGFLVLIVHLIVLFWIALFFLTEIVRRHTQNPLAAALFASLVQGWVFAAWFVTT